MSVRAGSQGSEFSRGDLEQTIPARFELQASRRPDAVAVCGGGATLSYAALSGISNRMAGSVDAVVAGATPKPVALLMDQGPLLPAAILAILKAGHFYVPFDSSVPAERIARMLEYTEAAATICDRASLSLARTLGFANVVLAEDAAAGGGGPGEPYTIRGEPSSLAYVYFTSGSTGEPKGVMDCHRNVLHNIMRYTNALRIGAGDRLPLLQTAGFSGAVSSLFCALLNGAACFPLSPKHATPGALASWVNANELTMWHSVPSLFRHLCASGEKFPSIRVVRLEGDQASPGDVALFTSRFGSGCVLVNGLGATETGITRQWFYSAGSPVPVGRVPIGYAVEDMEAVLLDAEDGIGEVAIKSEFLAVGYWKQPQLTAHAFAHCSGGGGRLYRTGDLGRMLPDGCLEHLGRKDHVVKIAGNRVDVSAVEAALCALPEVEQAVVDARADLAGEARLCAWLVCRPGAARLNVSAVRRTLARQFPPYAIPLVYSTIPALPLNGNGKVDRRILPDPVPARHLLDTAYAAPESEAERQVSRVWSNIFGMEDIGLDDDFFELGGSSLQAARLASELGMDLEMFLSRPTVRGVAQSLQVTPACLSRLIVRVSEGSLQPALFCAPPHSGLLLGYLNLARHTAPGRAIRVFTPPPVAEALEPYTVKSLAVQYLDAMRAEQPTGPYVLIGYCFGGWVAYEMACALERARAQPQLLILVECYYEGWLLSQTPVRQAMMKLGHGARRAAAHVRRGPSHWAALRQRVSELRRESSLQEEFDRLIAAGLPLTEQLRDPRFANRMAARSFAPAPYSGRTLLFEASSPRAGEYPAALMGWGDLLQGHVEVCTLADDLKSLLSEPVVSQVARRIEAALAQR